MKKSKVAKIKVNKNNSKKEKRGFTLIELLAIVILLAIIISLVYPSMVKILQNKSNEIDSLKEKTVFNAASSYLKSNPNIYSSDSGNIYCFDIKMLYGENLIPFEVEELENKKVYVRVGNNKNYYNIVDSTDQKCSGENLSIPTYEIDKTGWQTSKTVKITYPGGYTNEYSIDGGITWQEYKKPVEFTSDGTIIARITDGDKEIRAEELTISQIDNTPPNKVDFNYTVTSSSMVIIASAEDTESGIDKYSFSKDEGKTWTPLQTSKMYIFKNLVAGKYPVRVRAYNKTGAYKESKTKIIEPAAMLTPVYNVDKTGWQQDKTVSIAYTDGYTKEYSLDLGKTWLPYEKPIKFTESGTIIARISDGVNVVKASALTVDQIDGIPPVLSEIAYTVTSKSITVVGIGDDNESGIEKYSFSNDGGATWTALRNSNTYVFDDLRTGSYDLKLRVYDKARNYLESDLYPVATSIIDVPRYVPNTLLPTLSVVLTIEYDKTDNVYIHEYSTDNGATWHPYEKPLTLTENVDIIARSRDGVNIVTAASYSITNIDSSGPELTIGKEDIGARKVTIHYSSFDDMSEITETVCRFGNISTDYNLTVKYASDENGTSCYSEDYTPGSKYYYEICVTNALGLKTCKTGEGETPTVVDATPVYHEHTGSASGGGGCYGQANYVSEPFTDYGQNCHDGPYWSSDPYAYCKSCDKLKWQHPVCSTYSFTNYRQVLTGYSINCGKTPGVTVDKYICPDGSTLSGTKCYYN